MIYKLVGLLLAYLLAAAVSSQVSLDLRLTVWTSWITYFWWIAALLFLWFVAALILVVLASLKLSESRRKR